MAELCLNGASAVLAACGARPGAGRPVERRVSLEAERREILLVRWLQEVLYGLEVRGAVPERFEIEVSPGLKLVARWKEVPLAGIDKPIKAVTYSALEVRETKDGLEATVVFDV
jgi:SHS2 domain-containing protein